MKKLAECDGSLVWVQPSMMRRAWEFRNGEDVVAALEWQSAFQAAAVGVTEDSRYSFKLEGFFKSWVTIQKVGDESAPAIFRALPSFNGVLEIPDGPKYSWDSNFWLTKWLWSDSEGTELLRATRNLTLRTEGTAEWDPVALENPHVPLLLLLGWYLIVQVSDIRPS